MTYPHVDRKNGSWTQNTPSPGFISRFSYITVIVHKPSCVFFVLEPTSGRAPPGASSKPGVGPSPALSPGRAPTSGPDREVFSPATTPKPWLASGLPSLWVHRSASCVPQWRQPPCTPYCASTPRPCRASQTRSTIRRRNFRSQRVTTPCTPRASLVLPVFSPQITSYANYIIDVAN